MIASGMIYMVCWWMVLAFIASVLAPKDGWKWTVEKPMRLLFRGVGKLLRWLFKGGAKALGNTLRAVGRLVWQGIVGLWRWIRTPRSGPAPGAPTRRRRPRVI